MDKIEFNQEKLMSYNQLVDYLLKKYGAAQHDYFTSPTCKTKNKEVVRTSEGLFCHHIFENKVMQLAESFWAARESFEYQRADALVYCNYLEHFLLHRAIALEKPNGILKIFNSKSAYHMHMNMPLNGGLGEIQYDCNSLYNDGGSSQKWRQRCFEEIEDNFEEYIIVLSDFVQLCIDRFEGDKEIPAKEFFVGKKMKHSKKGVGEIIEIVENIDKDPQFQTIVIKFGDEIVNVPREFLDMGSFREETNKLIESVSKDRKGNVLPKIYDAVYAKINF